MASGIQLKVAPNTLKNKANEITKEINTVERQWKKLQETITRSKSYWEGDASNIHQKYISTINSDVTTLIKRLKEHPTELLKMAQLYDEAEQKASQLAAALPKDVIT